MTHLTLGYGDGKGATAPTVLYVGTERSDALAARDEAKGYALVLVGTLNTTSRRVFEAQAESIAQAVSTSEAKAPDPVNADPKPSTDLTPVATVESLREVLDKAGVSYRSNASLSTLQKLVDDLNASKSTK